MQAKDYALHMMRRATGAVPPTAIAVMFNKQQVRQRKLAHFLKTFGPEALPEGPALARMMGTFQFFVDGWNDDPRDLIRFIERNFGPLNAMMEHAGMSELDNYHRTRETCGSICA